MSRVSHLTTFDILIPAYDTRLSREDSLRMATSIWHTFHRCCTALHCRRGHSPRNAKQSNIVEPRGIVYPGFACRDLRSRFYWFAFMGFASNECVSSLVFGEYPVFHV